MGDDLGVLAHHALQLLILGQVLLISLHILLELGNHIEQSMKSAHDFLESVEDFGVVDIGDVEALMDFFQFLFYFP